MIHGIKLSGDTELPCPPSHSPSKLLLVQLSEHSVWSSITKSVVLNWEINTEIHTSPCVKQIANGKLLYNTRNSACCSVKTWRSRMGWELGRRFKREETYAYPWLVQADVREKPTQHYKEIILQLRINKFFWKEYCPQNSSISITLEFF